MRAPDVNVLLYALDPTSPHRELARTVLQPTPGGEGLVLFPAVIAGFVRLATDRRVFALPASADAALAAVDALVAAPHIAIAAPGPRVWPLMSELVSQHALRGPDVSDAFHAACALEQGATWVSFDRGFARFAALRFVHPLDAQ